MELLVRVAEAGSMTRAAAQVHLTPAAVSASVQRIEEALGMRLFERSTRSLRPTNEGALLIEGCRDLVDLWRRTLDDAREHGTELAGSVTLSAPADTAYEVIQPVAAALHEEHPALQIVIHTSDTPQHLQRDAIDMAIRYGRLADSTLSARKLVECPGVLVAAPTYLAEAGAPTSLRALESHRCLTLHLRGQPMRTWPLRHRGRAKLHEVRPHNPLCGDGFLARRWAVDGHGITFKSLFDVIDDLEDGRLVHVLPQYAGEPIPIHAVFPSRRFIPARVRAIHGAIASRFAERAARCTAWMKRT